MALSGTAECCWISMAPQTAYAKLEGKVVADVAVIGAGIVGLTAAYILAKAGLAVVLVEARQIGRQVTGRSSAKITSQHALIYRQLIDNFDLDVAKAYASASRAGVEQIRTWVKEFNIDCAFESKEAYAYISYPARRGDIEAEAEAAHKVGFEADVLDKAPLPFDTAGALRFRNEAQFNPTAYLIGLAKAAEGAGVRIFENSRVTEIKPDKRWQLSTDAAQAAVKHVVIATNLPIGGSIHYDHLTQPRCHIAMAFRTAAENAIDGMFIGIDEPTHSLRMGRDRDGPLLIALGPRFNTGQDGDVAARFHGLERWVRTNLPVGDTAWRWANEDYESADRLPFVGAPSQKEPGLYVATAFNGWGISNGTAAGMLVADQIRGRPNSWGALYDPARPAAKDFNKSTDTQSSVDSIDSIAAGEGGVVTSGEQKFAVWKDANGAAHVLSAACTHMGCIVTWNNAESTWDCPCHGSVFAADGSVLHGPAVTPLKAKVIPFATPRPSA